MNADTGQRTADELRCELAQGLAILERLGIVDFNGHMSARLGDGSVLINSGSSVRSAISLDDFVVVGADGRHDESAPRPPAELALHLAVYAARPEVGAVMHGHPRWSTLLSATGTPYRVVFAQGALLGEVPVFESPRSVNNEHTAAEVAALLGIAPAAMLQSHGSVVVGRDVLEATVLAIYMEQNAERQVAATALGGARVFSGEEAEACRKGLNKRGLFEKCWNYYLEKFEISVQ